MVWLYMSIEVWLAETGWGSNGTMVSINEDINSEEAIEDLEGAEDLESSEEVNGSEDSENKVFDSEQHQKSLTQTRKAILTLILRLSICPVRMMRRLWMVSMASAACRFSQCHRIKITSGSQNIFPPYHPPCIHYLTPTPDLRKGCNVIFSNLLLKCISGLYT